MSSSAERPRPPQRIAGGRFEVDKKLGAGCFGEVWRYKTADTKEDVAVKFEDLTSHALQLEHEAEILRTLASPMRPQGVVEFLHYGREGRYHCLAMELLGKSLEDRMQSCGCKFNVRTAVLVAEQVLLRIEYLHSKCILHRDIKPENFMFGKPGNKVHHLYMIDFGLSKRYYDQKHSQIRTKLSLTGTARYASINAHRGIEQSRRDDLEAIGHMLMYFLRSSLPWSGLEAKTQEEKYRKIKEKKEQVQLKDLCAGFPEAFERYLDYSRHLNFTDRPDYNMLKKLFRDLRESPELTVNGPVEDHMFQWFDGKDIAKQYDLVQIIPNTGLRQPDDAVPSKRGCFCFCGGSSKVSD